MKTAQDLREALRIIDGRGYASYKDIAGEYGFDDFILYIDRVQGDPFASPSRVRVRVYQDIAGFPKDTYTGKSRETALRDYLARAFNAAAERFSLGEQGERGERPDNDEHARPGDTRALVGRIHAPLRRSEVRDGAACVRTVGRRGSTPTRCSSKSSRR